MIRGTTEKGMTRIKIRRERGLSSPSTRLALEKDLILYILLGN